jgi:hypothetical protein
MTVYVLAVLSSIIGRAVMALALAISNGYVGSLAFADRFAIRFFKAVMSANPSLDKTLAMHEAHASAHWSGIVIMVLLDLCIFIFGFAPAIEYKGASGQKKLLNLEPISLSMAILSALLGGVGFIDMESASLGASSVLEIVFGFIFASVAPILMFYLTKYIKVADTELVESVTKWVTGSLKNELTEMSTLKQNTPRTQTSQPIKREPVAVGSTFDFANLDEALNKFKN